jgi:hypothetical protein
VADADAVFRSLAGRWELSRTLEPGLGTASGTATFTPDGADRLHYREDVELRLATGYSGTGYREYRYELEGRRIRVRLADGVTMHVLDLGGPGGPGASTGSPEAGDVHHCRADDYLGVYRFGPGERFSVEMTVTGPAKDYRILTGYHRS